MANQVYQERRRLFGYRVATLRQALEMTQERLAECIDKTVDYVSLLERGERSPSFEALCDLAAALAIPLHSLLYLPEEGNSEAAVEAIAAQPVAPELVRPVENAIVSLDKRSRDLDRLRKAIEGIEEMQHLASEYGIRDIFQDNGGKTLQLLILLGLRISPGREGNDAIDANGREYELKTINISGRKNPGITTHHHLNSVILTKYRQVAAWYIGIYEDIKLKEIYKLLPEQLEPVFRDWEGKLKTRDSLNNPKIPMKLIRQGELVYADEDEGSKQMQLL